MTTTQLTRNTSNGFAPESSVVQVKMFIANNPRDAEKSVDEWLKENDVMIYQIAQSQSEKNGSFVFVLTIFYQPAD